MSEECTDDQPAPDFQTAFWSAKHALSVATSVAFSRHGVHEGQQFILRRLWAQDGLTPGDIARRLGLATPTVTRAATRMEAACLFSPVYRGESGCRSDTSRRSLCRPEQ
jgi:MarR family transcriptional regulator, organic hydroperoxide resistance regulator